jgi:beta-lysine N6-acetyltransferase
MSDKVEKIGLSLIQHGKFNDRIYLLKMVKDDFPDIIEQMDKMVEEFGYTKICIKIPAHYSATFKAAGFKPEGFIPDFYEGKHDVVFMGKFYSSSREMPDRKELEKFQDVVQKEFTKPDYTLNPKFMLRKLNKKDAEKMAEVYGKVFKTYPFPIHDPEYIKETMRENIDYFGVWAGDKLIAVASSEKDEDALNAEMTDFATLPDYRGNHLAYFLLLKMEEDMKKQGYKCLYTIARLKSIGMNVTFLKAGYRYNGTLINNTNISGGLESMNILYKLI